MERFIRFDLEEKKRKVMGLSTFRRAAELKALVTAAVPERLSSSECDAALASRILSQKEVLKAAWSEDTCRRYLMISDRFNTEANAIMAKWEMKFGRFCLLDSAATMRSAVTAAQTEEQMTTLVKTLFWEQTCKVRTSLEGRTKVGGGGNSTALLRAMLLRHLFYQYIQQIFPKLVDILGIYGTWKFYGEMYGMDEHGRMNATDSSESEDHQEQNTQDEGPQTRFESKHKLKLLMDGVAKGRHDTMFVSMTRVVGSAVNLNLGCEGMATVHKFVNDIFTLYNAEFPDTPQGAVSLPSTEINVNASAGVYTPAHVKASSRIETAEEYQEKLSAYQGNDGRRRKKRSRSTSP